MSKYLSATQIRRAIDELSAFHIFFGTTFLVLKDQRAPIGAMANIGLDAANREHLRKYFRVNPKSECFFTPFQIKKNEIRWRPPNYASTSLQAINTQGFADALLHEKKSARWGWRETYLDFLKLKLPQGKRLPLFHLSVWFLRNDQWPDEAGFGFIVNQFTIKYDFSADELSALFDCEIPDFNGDAFASGLVAWNDIIAEFGDPPDLPIEGGSILQLLEASRVGPAHRIKLEPARRLNIITGDNGLGKTFLLDLIWWALTQNWTGRPATQISASSGGPTISFVVSATASKQPVNAVLDLKSGKWSVPKLSSTSGLTLYAKIDGSFSVWDPVSATAGHGASALEISRDEVWFGDTSNKIEGLVRDWVKWQLSPSHSGVFATFKRMIERLRPPEGEFSLGQPVRIQGYAMEIPTILHSYGSVPIIYESAGIRRILSIAYLVVWAWEEHKIAARLNMRKQERQIVFMIDEAEAHLHPRWQRILLPALLGIPVDLHDDLSIQFFVATHSPLILASAEPVWDDESDTLFHLDLDRSGRVVFSEIPFERRGTADSWLRSEAFDEVHPGSFDAEAALKSAKELIQSANPEKARVEDVTRLLEGTLPAEDPFWLRWILFTNKFGDKQ